jgi:hypothetical protein
VPSRIPLLLTLLTLLTLLALCLASPTQAHTVLFQRLVHVRVQPEMIEVAMGIVIHAGPEALKLRSRFDLDGDEVLSRDEQDQLANWLDAEAFRDFNLTIGDDPLTLDGRERSLKLTHNHRADLGEGLTFRTVRQGRVALRPGTRQLVVHEAPGNLREMIAIRIDLHAGLSLESSDSREGASRLVPASIRSWQALVRTVPGDLILNVEVAPRGAPAQTPEP